MDWIAVSNLHTDRNSTSFIPSLTLFLFFLLVRPSIHRRMRVSSQHQRALARRTSEMLRLLADLELLRDEGERGLGHFTPPVVNDQGMPAVGHLVNFRDGRILLLLLIGGTGDRRWGGAALLARNAA